MNHAIITKIVNGDWGAVESFTQHKIFMVYSI